MDKKKGIIGGSEAPVITDKKVTTTPPTTSIGATTPSQSEEETQQTPQTPPQTMPAQPQPTQVAPTAPSLAAQPPGEEYDESPQAPPTTPAPAVTTTAPQYDDTDRRNQANLAAQTTDATPSTEGEEFRSYRDILAKYAPLTSDEDKRKQMRRERRKAIVSALGDGLSALSNLYFTTKGAPDQGLKPGMTDAAKKRMDDLRAQWQKEKDKYQDLMLKGLEMDREQGNFLKSYKLQLNADKRAEEKFAKEMPMLEKEMAMLDEKIRKLKDDNDLDEKTKANRIAVAQAELEAKKRDYDYRKTHHGFSEKEDIERKDKERRHRESLAARRTGGGGKSGKGGGDNRNKRKGYNTLSSVNAGKTFHPNNQQVQDAYRYLAGRNFVEGKATTIQGMLNEIQHYMTTGRNRNAKSHGKNRVDDIIGGPIVDTLLGGEWDNASDNEGAYDNF